MNITDIQQAWNAVAQQVGDHLMKSNVILSELVIESERGPVALGRLVEARSHFAQAGMKIGALIVQRNVAEKQEATCPDDQARKEAIIFDTQEILLGHGLNESIF